MDQQVAERPQSARYRWARRRADELTEPYDVPPIPVLEIAERNGVDVRFVRFDVFEDEIAGFCDFEAHKLYVNDLDPLTRKTFTIAHELGHWVLHRDFFLANPEDYPVLPRFQKPDRDNPLEQEANAFAAALLVPKRLLRPVAGTNITVLAKMFAVSREMMEFRVKNVRSGFEG